MSKYKIILMYFVISIFVTNVYATDNYVSMHDKYGGVCNQYRYEDFKDDKIFYYTITKKYFSYNSFKIFIPPGTLGVNSSFSKQYYLDKIGYVEKYKSPPDCEYCDEKYYDIPFTSRNDTFYYRLDTLLNKEVYTRNKNGTSFFAGYLGYEVTDEGLSEEDSGWLYFKRVGEDTKPPNIHDTQLIAFTLRVNVETYFNWLAKAKKDPNSVCYVDNTPVNTCDSEHMNLCTNQTSCERYAHGHFYDGSCHAELPCDSNTLNQCNTADKCEMSGFHFYDGSCHAELPCDSTTLSQCDTADKCNISGFNFYDNACFVQPACDKNNLSECSQDNCTYEANLTKLYYYDGECHDKPKEPTVDPTECSKYYPDKCSKRECDNINELHWCSSENMCKPYYVRCEGSGGNDPGSGSGHNNPGGSGGNCITIFGITTCSGGQSSNICDSAHPNNCNTQVDCQGSGNFWCDNHCYDNNNIPVSCQICSKEHLEWCKDNNSCLAIGKNWCDNHCYDENDLPASCKPKLCDAQHADGCENQESCKSNNHIWVVTEFRGETIKHCVAKNASYLPKFTDDNISVTLKSKLTDRYEKFAFPLYLGDDLLDGIINKGDMLDIKAKLYPLDRNYDLYLILHLAGDNSSYYLLFNNDNDTLGVTSDIVPLEENISSDGDYRELSLGHKFDLCDILDKYSLTDVTAYYLALPTSDEYEKINVVRRMNEQEHAVGQFKLDNKCVIDHTCDNDPSLCKSKETCEDKGHLFYVWCGSYCTVSYNGQCPSE